MDPRMHPDDERRSIKPPDAELFGNQTRFIALRSLEGDYRRKLDQYTRQHDLGDIIWPAYTLLYDPDLPEIVQELKNRNLYLFDLWGYVPGSGPGGYWQQFKVPREALELFENELSDRWLGMDNGEQDGRYIGAYARQLYPSGSARERQYLNFQHHFEGLCNRLGNKMATLVSLNYGHYFMKEEVYTLIGAETAQGLPNTQLYYSFIRGAGKQYGVPWFGNASVWNRWGWKNYSGNTDYNGGDSEGTSLSLLKRLMYNHILYNCVAVGFESSLFDGEDRLSPIGQIQKSAHAWVREHGHPGVMYTPVAVMLDFFSGWTFPRHLYTSNVYRVWGNIPYEEGDHLTDGILDMFYPGYQDASYFHDETGFITPTPYGDIADCILSDSPLWLLKQYPVLILGGKINEGMALKDKLEAYVEMGGQLIMTAGNLASLPGGIAGMEAGSKTMDFEKGSLISFVQFEVEEETGFSLREMSFPSKSKIIASCNDVPAIIQSAYGNGMITIFSSDFGICETGKDAGPVRLEIDHHLVSPYALLNHVRIALDQILDRVRIFDAGEGLSLITCRKQKGEYTLGICNATWTEKPFQIKSFVGSIKKLEELKLDCREQQAIGFLPRDLENNTGVNSENTIAGGDIRIFMVHLEEESIEEIPFINPEPNPSGRGLTLRNITSIKEEILHRPDFFQHFDRVVVDWRYFHQREIKVLHNEAGWIKRQGLKITGDFSSGINLFPDLRLVLNDTAEYNRSLAVIRGTIDKMAALGVDELILTSHKMVENNFTREQFRESLVATLREICRYGLEYRMKVHFRISPWKYAGSVPQASNLAASVNEHNFYIAPSLAMLLDRQEEAGQNQEFLKNLKSEMIFISRPEHDIQGKLWNINKPVHACPDQEKIKKFLELCPGKNYILDGIYRDRNEEYMDIKTLEILR
jgi:hypothetical protein